MDSVEIIAKLKWQSRQHLPVLGGGALTTVGSEATRISGTFRSSFDLLFTGGFVSSISWVISLLLGVWLRLLLWCASGNPSNFEQNTLYSV